jgi:hypothetical protein
MPRDSKNLTDVVEYFDPLSEEQKAKARVTVCHFAENTTDATELMLALGIHPSQNEDFSRVGGIPKINEGSGSALR